MTEVTIKKLYYCPVKSLSFNESKSVEIIHNIGIKNDRFLAFTRGLNKKTSKHYMNNSQVRNLNYFLTLRNSPYLKKYNFIFDGKKNCIELYLKNKKLIEANIYNSIQVIKIQKFIEDLDDKIKKPIYLIHNNKFPFFDTTPNISISMINFNTIRDLEKTFGKKIEFERFRSNIYIDNLKPWDEFKLLNKIIKIGNVKFKVDSKIPRCSITNINPNNFNLDINLPNTLIRKYGHRDMGVYLIPLNSGLIKKNDKIILN